MALVTIKTYPIAATAHVDSGILKNSGIPSFVSDEYISGAEITAPGLGYIKLQVPEEVVDKATAILAEVHEPSGVDGSHG